MEQKQKTADAGEIKVDKKSKALFIVLGILIAGSIAVTYWRYMVKRDYVIQAQIDCDPETENCLVWKCDPMSLEEGEACTGNPDNDIWYYKILNRNAKNIPNCDPEDENCTAYQCDPGEPECEIASCSPDNITEGEECSTPEQYLLENPPEDECEEGDEECLAEEDIECAEDDEECLAGQEAVECEESDEECLLEEESAECDPESEDCSGATQDQCAPGDENCASDSNNESAPATSEKDSTKNPAKNIDNNINVPPPGVEPI